jgi:hypothetical protein
MTVFSLPKTTLDAHPHLLRTLSLLSVTVITRGSLIEFIPRSNGHDLLAVLEEASVSYGLETDEELSL